jgi:hypothetical protein
MLDLNKAEDARRYVIAYVNQREAGKVAPQKLMNLTDEDILRMAKQLFLYCDPRKAAGFEH